MSSGASHTSSAGRAQTFRRIGMLGVGIMGHAMASNLIKAGFEVSAYDPDAKALKRLKAAGGRPCKSVAQLAGSVQVIISCLPSAAALHSNAQQMAVAGNRELLVVEASTLTRPSASCMIWARLLPANRCTLVTTSWPAARAASSVSPQKATSGWQ